MIPNGYRKNGVLLTLPWDAAYTLVERGVGNFDCLGDSQHGMGVAVDGRRISNYNAGGVPMLTLEPGGFIIARDNKGDRLVARQSDIDSQLFDEPPPTNLLDMWSDESEVTP